MTKYTVKSWFEYWLSTFVMFSIKQSTFATYQYYIEKHVIPKIGEIPLHLLTVDQLQSFYNEKYKSGNLKTGKGLNPKTIRNIHLMIHEGLKSALGLGFISKNVSEYVRLPKQQKKQIQILSPAQQSKLVQICKNEYDGFGIILTMATGIRLGELLGLQWKNVDLDEGIVHIVQTLNRLPNYDKTGKKTALVIGTPKSANSFRDIPLNEEVLKLMQKYYNERKHLSDFVISNENGLPIEPRTYQDLFKRYLQRADISGITFHGLRHTFATRAMENDISPKVVCDLLGHANVSTTLDLYSHVLLKSKREAIEKLSYLSV